MENFSFPLSSSPPAPEAPPAPPALLSSSSFPDIRLIATDMDGTLTQNGKFTSALLQALEKLAQAGREVLIITGRSAGWVSGLVSYLPVVGAIAENGGLFYRSDTDAAPVLLTSIPNLNAHRQALAATFAQLQIQFPQIQESTDNAFRLTDWTFDVQGLNQSQLQQMAAVCHQLGWGFTYSNVQCHIKPITQDKATGLLQVWRNSFADYTPVQLVTVGDSPNDESLFDKHKFPISVGVANVLNYANHLTHLPTYVTTAPEVEGFCQLADLLIGEIGQATFVPPNPQ